MGLFGLFSGKGTAGLETGDLAPDFNLPDQHMKTHSLHDYTGKWLVIYFYPKDNTPGCTREACNFRDDITRLRALNAEVLGVSLDSIHSHAKFADKHGLPFPLLSDEKYETAKKYGCLLSLGPIRLAKRHTFIIDTEGKIAKIYRKVNPAGHINEVIDNLKTLQAM